MTTCPFCLRVLRLTIVALVAGAILLTGAPGFASDAAPVRDDADAVHSRSRDPLLLDDAPPRGPRPAPRCASGSRSRLYYYETIPSKWDWSLTKAVSKWNASGGGIKLTRTIYRSKAKVKISYGNTGGAAGMATIGSTSGAYVRLSSRYAAVDSADAWRRIAVMAIFTHELGHVLGYGHTTATCSLMRAVLDISACHLPPTSPPGYHKCRTIDARSRAQLRQEVRRPRPPSQRHLVPDRPDALRADRRQLQRWRGLAGHGPLDQAHHRAHGVQGGDPDVARGGVHGHTVVGRHPSWSRRQPCSGRTTKPGRTRRTASGPGWSTASAPAGPRSTA